MFGRFCLMLVLLGPLSSCTKQSADVVSSDGGDTGDINHTSDQSSGDTSTLDHASGDSAMGVTDQEDLSAAFRKIQLDYQQAARSFNRQLREATSPAERQQLTDHAPRHEQFIQSALKLFEGHEADDAFMSMAIWAVQLTDDEEVLRQILEQVEKHHLENPRIARFLQTAVSQRIPATINFVNKLAEPGDSAVSMLARLVSLSLMDPERDRERIVQTLESVVAFKGPIEFGGQDYKALAEGELFALTRLQVGAEAPEIEGEDVNGVPFRLSDYRGKVVMLDFWGNW